MNCKTICVRNLIYILITLFCGLSTRLYAQEGEQQDEPGIVDSVLLQKPDSIILHLKEQSSSLTALGALRGNPKLYVAENGNIGTPSQAIIRGVSSINLPASIQVYVDGIPLRYSRSLPSFLSNYDPDRLIFLNPQDIANVHVIGGANDYPILGGRGANGAVYLETERGEFGGTKLDVSVNHGFSQYDYTIPRFGSEALKAYLWERMAADGLSYDERSAHPIFDPNAAETNNETDWLKDIRQTGTYKDYHVKLKGGDGDANYLFSLGYTDKDGTIKNNEMQRVGLRFNLDYRLSQKIEIVNNLSYTNSWGRFSEYGSNYSIHPIYVAAAKAPFFSPNYYDQEGVRTGLMAGVDTLGFSNPNALVNNMENSNRYNRIDGLMGLRWNLADDWKLTANLSVNYTNLIERQYRPALGIAPDEYRIRQNAERSSSEFGLIGDVKAVKTGDLTDQIAYKASLMASIDTYEEKSMYGRKVNAGTDDYETLKQGIVDSASNTKFKSNLMTFIAQGELKLSNRAYLSAFVNLQGTSNFGSQGRWNVYPGATVSVNLLEENQPTAWAIDVAYSRTGNHDLRGFYHYNLYYPVNYFGYGGAYFGNAKNENIRPEKTDTYEAGSTLSLLNNRISLRAGYYYKQTNDLITYRSAPNELGLGVSVENSGSVINQGIEVSLISKLIQKKDLRWDLNVNVSTLKNSVESLANGSIERTFGNVTGIAMEGESIGSFYGYKISGVFESDEAVNLMKADGTPYMAGDYIVEDVNNDQKINALDRQVIGSPLPTLFGNLFTQLSYKELGLSAQLSFASGQDIYNRFDQQMHSMKDYANQNPDVSQRWKSSTETGNGLSRAALDDPSNNTAASDLWIEDGSYLKLKSLTVHYDIAKITGSKAFKNIKLYATAENLWTLTDYSGFDPEISNFTDPLLRNIDFGAPPLGRTYIFGVKATF
ncbi:SusC/RagA family TonB-linked outer membrane protein [Albibacterium profundi]|uniref:SusC/RagA family TonB-linked outer membrane protein n=1 Tax=Albibacterium profundi TaxID=3134906 RepID=A0ABV5CEQ5_9SPHI